MKKLIENLITLTLLFIMACFASAQVTLRSQKNIPTNLEVPSAAISGTYAAVTAIAPSQLQCGETAWDTTNARWLSYNCATSQWGTISATYGTPTATPTANPITSLVNFSDTTHLGNVYTNPGGYFSVGPTTLVDGAATELGVYDTSGGYRTGIGSAHDTGINFDVISGAWLNFEANASNSNYNGYIQFHIYGTYQNFKIDSHGNYTFDDQTHNGGITINLTTNTITVGQTPTPTASGSLTIFFPNALLTPVAAATITASQGLITKGVQ